MTIAIASKSLDHSKTNADIRAIYAKLGQHKVFENIGAGETMLGRAHNLVDGLARRKKLKRTQLRVLRCDMDRIFTNSDFLQSSELFTEQLRVRLKSAIRQALLASKH